ncbi:hypothetical protein [Pseudomonas monteilii]|uniref:hypothetical protein n=1 Tax=Pseudomonas monteilii TaxID=76759 RepID=UPI001E49A48B|nr:hypothetical protein [Pseudomonas monteilii]MCE0877053.1 hypothetical protein [Pseudomonas monteilii]WJN86121.1 hypothetical protein LU680_17875 [Pseudomonas monteilii]WJO30783.1 hypothetical protein LU690_16940 [Pseudomonas monteilii]WJR48276.1 hypothetical protein LU655_016520 [Pseudomonas monteilii]WMM94846.1 hypothetical protein [Pseudomonas monteilii]
MAEGTRKPWGYAAVTLIPTGIGFAFSGLMTNQPAFIYSGLGIAIPGVLLAVIHFWSARRRA